jgi:hypothetical protein
MRHRTGISFLRLLNILLGICVLLSVTLSPQAGGVARPDESGIYNETFDSYAKKDFVAGVNWNISSGTLTLDRTDGAIQRASLVAEAPTGELWAAWDGNGGTFLRLFDAQGNPLWQDPLNLVISGGACAQQIDVDSNGNAIVVWLPGMMTGMVTPMYTHRN